MQHIVTAPVPRQKGIYGAAGARRFIGGAAGGGKSDALLCEALRQVHIPHYRALLLRKTYPQLSELIDRSQSLYPPAFRAPDITVPNMFGSSKAARRFILVPCSTRRTVSIIRENATISLPLTS